jgi:plastin-1
MRVVNVKDGLTQFPAMENLNLVVNSAKAIGCSIVNIGAGDIWDMIEHLILGVIWQVIRIGLMNQINLKSHPELYRLLEPGEDIKTFLNLPPEKILLRWVNYHLKNAGSDKRIHNFSGDIKDSEAYTILLNQLDKKCDLAPLKEKDVNKRAEGVLNNARKINCAKFVKGRDIVAGNPKLNMAFVANLFNTIPGLEALKEEELKNLDFPETGSREARAFQLWINSLGIDPFINNLFDDLRDGLALLRIMDKIDPGTVNWKRVNQQAPMHRIKQVENANYAVELGKDLKFSLVGIGGVDIANGNETLTLALVWQLMRHHVLAVLKEVGGGAPVSEQQMIKWSNDVVASTGKPSRMANFKDSSLKTSQFFLELIDGIRKNFVDWSLVNDPAVDVKQYTENAKLAINLARKLGATIFLLPEDIVEGKDKMILTFIGSLMAVGKKEGK